MCVCWNLETPGDKGNGKEIGLIILHFGPLNSKRRLDVRPRTMVFSSYHLMTTWSIIRQPVFAWKTLQKSTNTTISITRSAETLPLSPKPFSKSFFHLKLTWANNVLQSQWSNKETVLTTTEVLTKRKSSSRLSLTFAWWRPMASLLKLLLEMILCFLWRSRS